MSLVCNVGRSYDLYANPADTREEEEMRSTEY